jgi:outer membrane murein-binding lipoprotein Lpp
MAEILGISALLGSCALAVALVVVRAHLATATTKIDKLERRIADLDATVERTRAGASAAMTTARRAAAAAGAEDPPPRLAFEPVTGPVVKALAFGGGARRALSSLASVRTHRAARSRSGSASGSVQ